MGPRQALGACGPWGLIPVPARPQRAVPACWISVWWRPERPSCAWPGSPAPSHRRATSSATPRKVRGQVPPPRGDGATRTPLGERLGRAPGLRRAHGRAHACVRAVLVPQLRGVRDRRRTGAGWGLPHPEAPGRALTPQGLGAHIWVLLTHGRTWGAGGGPPPRPCRCTWRALPAPGCCSARAWPPSQPRPVLPTPGTAWHPQGEEPARRHPFPAGPDTGRVPAPAHTPLCPPAGAAQGEERSLGAGALSATLSNLRPDTEYVVTLRARHAQQPAATATLTARTRKHRAPVPRRGSGGGQRGQLLRSPRGPPGVDRAPPWPVAASVVRGEHGWWLRGDALSPFSSWRTPSAPSQLSGGVSTGAFPQVT